jgi:hypothetical protein
VPVVLLLPLAVLPNRVKLIRLVFDTDDLQKLKRLDRAAAKLHERA